MIIFMSRHVYSLGTLRLIYDSIRQLFSSINKVNEERKRERTEEERKNEPHITRAVFCKRPSSMRANSQDRIEW